uniref:DEP domain containing 1B n=2 Tax=Hominidae TaxID=9604 RepID=D6RDV9_HUMAN
MEHRIVGPGPYRATRLFLFLRPGAVAHSCNSSTLGG